MPKKSTPLISTVEYEHRDGAGKLASKGYQKVDWRGNTHIIQKDGKGRMIGEVVVDKNGMIVKSVEGDPENKQRFESLVKAIQQNSSNVESKSNRMEVE